MTSRNPSQFNNSNRVIPKTLFDTKGDLIVGGADNQPKKLAAGANGLVLVADSTATNGVKWDYASKSGLPLLSLNANYQLSLNDPGFILYANTTNNITITVPTNTTAAIPTGSSVIIIRPSTGTVTIAAASGVTIHATPGLKLRAQYSVAALLKTGLNTWILHGDISA